MLKLRKIPLQSFIELLQDLYDSGAGFIDLSGEQSNEGNSPRDFIQITIKPEYMLQDEEENDEEDFIQEIDYSNDNIIRRKSLSDEDINELI